MKSRNYILDSARMLTPDGRQPPGGAPRLSQKQRREDASKRCREALVEVREAMVAEGQAGVSLCLETMGRPSQIGSLEEIIDFVQLDPSSYHIVTVFQVRTSCETLGRTTNHVE